MTNDDLNLAPEDEKTGGSKKLIIIILAAVLLLGGGGGAAWFFLGQDKAPPADSVESESTDNEEGEDTEDEEDDGEQEQEAEYWPLAPAFIINFPLDDGVHYLQVDLQAMSYNSEAIDKLKAHTPAVRNDLILLFSSQDYQKLNTLEGKEELRQAALEQVNKTLRLKKKSKRIDDIYFTGFMMQ